MQKISSKRINELLADDAKAIEGLDFTGAEFESSLRDLQNAKDTISAAINSLKSALFHLKQSDLDTEGTHGLRQVESTLLNLKRRLGK